MTLSRSLSHPHSLAIALNFAAVLHQLRGEEQSVHERSAAALGVSTEQGFPLWLAYAVVLQGWTLTVHGQPEEGIRQIQQGLAALRATGAELARAYLLSLLAEAYEKLGQVEKGLKVLAEGLTIGQHTAGRLWEAELYRLKGELTRQQLPVGGLGSGVKGQGSVSDNPQSAIRLPPPLAQRGLQVGGNPQWEEAEAYFQQAIEIARRQEAKSLELRAVMSLSRLWQEQGKKNQARTILAEIYGWFTEGFETGDLKHAKRLLDELS